MPANVTSFTPEAFVRALRELDAMEWREGLTVEEIGSPQRIAPHAVAVTAELEGDGEDAVATARLILLHDPAGNPPGAAHSGWSATCARRLNSRWSPTPPPRRGLVVADRRARHPRLRRGRTRRHRHSLVQQGVRRDDRFRSCRGRGPLVVDADA
ncbi:DUF3000 family protein [Tessaracoccus sp. HDW20]|nr:DUF3000 family protein [Tessaracoccus coleopterorum]